jgi:diguanylate cyclase (GGDEF)-like protein
VCRSGGDEFAVILPDSSRDTGKLIANRIASGISEHVSSSTESRIDVPVSLSIGIATFPKDADERDGLIEFADKELYRDKNRYYESRGIEKGRR